MKSWHRMYWTLLAAGIFAAVASRPTMPQDQAPYQGQDAPQGQPQADPPARVARLDFTQGSVSFQPAGGGDSDWTAASVNHPMSTGDRLWADQDGRAELELGSTVIRLDHNTGVSFLTLADNSVQLQLSAGSVIVRMRRLNAGDAFEVDAPNLAFTLAQAGDYRLDADPDKNVTTVTVVQGKGTVTGAGRSWDLMADQRATFTGTDNLQYDLADADATPPADFDNWASGRDTQQAPAQSASSPTGRYVSPDVTGSEDLDTYGQWSTDPTYGPVWQPGGVPADWAPYHYGHWVWMAPWGWTWVEDEPWGFAPFHYGRWVLVGGRWAWVPGPVGVRPVYAPALVAWVGGTPGFNFSVAIGGGGGIGWFPLGPREVFVPGYRVSDAYVTRVNVTNTVVNQTTVVNVYHNNVTNITYVNQRAAGGVTVVSHDTFVNARPVARNVVVVPARDLAAAPVGRTFTPEPMHASLVGEGRPAAARPPAQIMNRTVVTARRPAPAPARFEERPGARPATFGNPVNNAPEGRTVQPAYRPVPRGGTDEANRNATPPAANPNARPAPRVFEEQGTPPAAQEPSRGVVNGANRNATPPAAQEPRGAAGEANRNPAPPAPNPYARPAPPVRQPTPAERQVDAAKQGQWQQQHEQVHQQAPPREAPPRGKSKEDDKRR